jgi:RNA polymerase sigma-70 factor (ECF subfamily)
MKIPTRTPEGEPRWCPLCCAGVVLETSVGHRDATCPRCGTLLPPAAGLGQPPLPDAGSRFGQTLDLVRQAHGGSGEALNQLFNRYYERVRRSVRARIGVRLRRRVDSGDILQQAFAKAFMLFPDFEMRNEGSFLNWLAQICVRQIHDEADKQKAPKRIQNAVDLDARVGEASGTLADVLPARDTGPSGRSIRNEFTSAVEECLEQLPAHYREVIVMRDYDGLEWREIAQRLGKNTDSAPRELHSRAMLALAKTMRRRGLAGESR